jgi:hypothetical protein
MVNRGFSLNRYSGTLGFRYCSDGLQSNGPGKQKGEKVMATLIALFIIFNGVVGIVLIVARILNDMISARQNLRRFLIKLGWEHYEADLWRQKQTGIIVSFHDAITMELQTSVHEKRVFKGHSFKEP